MDARINIIDERLKNIKRIIAVSGGKGGIGKSSVASVLALNLSKTGHKVGLMDLDFCGPSDHTILNIGNVFPEEKNGVIPPEIHGIKFMSIIYYASDKPLPVRGIDISNALIELLAITIWDKLDFLIIDMPPGIGDTTMDVIRLIKKIEFLIVTTQSKVTLEIVKKMLKLLKELKIPILGILENMKTTNLSLVKNQLKMFDVAFLGSIHFDEDFEEAIGNTSELIETGFSRDLIKVIKQNELFAQYM